MIDRNAPGVFRLADFVPFDVPTDVDRQASGGPAGELELDFRDNKKRPPRAGDNQSDQAARLEILSARGVAPKAGKVPDVARPEHNSARRTLRRELLCELADPPFVIES